MGSARKLSRSFSKLIGERVGDEVVLRVEVGVESAVSQAGVRHEGGDSRTFDAVALEPPASRVDDSPPSFLLVVVSVPGHACLLKNCLPDSLGV